MPAFNLWPNRDIINYLLLIEHIITMFVSLLITFVIDETFSTKSIYPTLSLWQAICTCIFVPE